VRRPLNAEPLDAPHMPWMAENSFDCVEPSGRRFRAIARIGTPERLPRDGKLSAYSRCKVSLVPLVAERVIAGDNNFQALCLSIEFLRTMLKVFAASGGQVLFPGTRSHIDLTSPSFLPWPDLERSSKRARTRPSKKRSRAKR
jgi:hypothetical protein